MAVAFCVGELLLRRRRHLDTVRRALVSAPPTQAMTRQGEARVEWLSTGSGDVTVLRSVLRKLRHRM